MLLKPAAFELNVTLLPADVSFPRPPPPLNASDSSALRAPPPMSAPLAAPPLTAAGAQVSSYIAILLY